MTPLRRHDMRLRSATTDEIAAVWDDRWYGLVVGLDTVYMPSDVDGLALVDDRDELVALVTYHVDGPAGQIVTLDTIIRGRGFGRRQDGGHGQKGPHYTIARPLDSQDQGRTRSRRTGQQHALPGGGG